jgi:cyclopropane fatty-acyl-phospholipid synthase-like methyltransferase
MTLGKDAEAGKKRFGQDMRRAWIQQPGVDFGTYHHASAEESAKIREQAAQVFTQVLRSLHPAGARLEILDAGCGLGFLTAVAAQCFPKAKVTGVDLFAHESMSEFSIAKAKQNMKALALVARTSFVKQDLTKAWNLAAQFDVVISNLVFHNIGKKRVHAYGRVFDGLKTGGHFVLGDLFPNEAADTAYLQGHSRLVQEIDMGNAGGWVYKLKLLEKRDLAASAGGHPQ